MGERLAWARNQQGLILQNVSDKSGLAIGYISQLEKGAAGFRR
jgi:transcriptional regulator with XRE-family HTH domain